jgi:hypothetical protein
MGSPGDDLSPRVEELVYMMRCHDVGIV